MRNLKPGEALVQVITDEATKRQLKVLAAMHGGSLQDECRAAFTVYLGSDASAAGPAVVLGRNGSAATDTSGGGARQWPLTRPGVPVAGRPGA